MLVCSEQSLPYLCLVAFDSTVCQKFWILAHPELFIIQQMHQSGGIDAKVFWGLLNFEEGSSYEVVFQPVRSTLSFAPLLDSSR